MRKNHGLYLVQREYYLLYDKRSAGIELSRRERMHLRCLGNTLRHLKILPCKSNLIK